MFNNKLEQIVFKGLHMQSKNLSKDGEKTPASDSGGNLTVNRSYMNTLRSSMGIK